MSTAQSSPSLKEVNNLTIDDTLFYERVVENYTIVLTSNKIDIGLNEVVTFTATVTDNNVPIVNKTIIFTDGTNTIGTATTNNNGVAILEYLFNTMGNYSIKAIRGSNESNTVIINIMPSLILKVTGSSFKECYSSTSLVGNNKYVDYGDGTVTSLSGQLKHTYTDGLNEHTIKIYNVTELRSNCFLNCTNLKEATVSSKVTKLGMASFKGTGLTNIILPSSINNLLNSCFENCTSLTNIDIPSSVTSIGMNVFKNCTSLTNIVIPVGVSSVGGNAFAYCTNLISLTIPKTVVGQSSWTVGCNNLIDYQLYWTTSIPTWNNDSMKVNDNTIFTIPNGCTSKYVAKSFPSDRLVERS